MVREKAWEELQIKNDFLFAKVMRDKKICSELLEKLLHIKVQNIVYLEEDKKIDIKLGCKKHKDGCVYRRRQPGV